MADAARTLDVEGARLTYDVRGSGPPLLLIPGGPADAGSFAPLVAHLAGGHTVVTYDPRGLSRSTRADQDADITVATQADDAHRLITALGAGPAAVLGSSGGAVTGLELVRRYPGAVSTLVAHEPPVIELLADRDRLVAQTREAYDTYRAAGPWPAMGAFMAMTGIPTPAGDAAGPPDPQRAAAMEAIRPNLELFFGHMLLEITFYVPDIDALRAAPTRVVVAAGTTSEGQTAYRAAHALARALGTTPVTFPGDHGGYATHPAESAEILGKLLTG